MRSATARPGPAFPQHRRPYEPSLPTLQRTSRHRFHDESDESSDDSRMTGRYDLPDRESEDND